VGFDPQLGRVFNFTAEELAENRVGRLSADQELIWRNTVAVARRGAKRGATMLVVALIAAAALSVVGVTQTPGGGGAGLIVPAVILPLIGLLAWFFTRRGRRDTGALAAGELCTAEGEFSWDSDMQDNWWGHVGGVRFSIDRLAEESLTMGARYRVHYLPMHRSAWVQSIERIDD
jgi:hypothetical protein